MGRPPNERLHATRAPLKSRVRDCLKDKPGSGSAIGERASGPAITLNINATSSTVLAIGPCTSSRNSGAGVGHTGTRPADGLSPTTLQNPAGFRSEPPKSVPSAIGVIPVATATAAPPLLPPHVLVTSYGFRVAPKTALNVWDPAPNSGVFVLPIVIAPASRKRSTIRPS